jgi:hypothetical protein
VPSGSYLHVDPVDGSASAVEEFSCAAGPAGWRYVATVRDPDGREIGRIDLTLDGGGRQARLVVAAGGWELRGGVAGRQTLWIRRPADPGATEAGSRAVVVEAPPEPAGVGPAAREAGAVEPGAVEPGGGEPGAVEAESVERAAVAAGFTGRSPAFFVAATRLLRLSPGARARLRLVELTEPALGTRVAEQGWSMSGVTSYATETGPLPVARYQVADLATGEPREVHLAGDVVVAAPGLELTALHSPPTL